MEVDCILHITLRQPHVMSSLSYDVQLSAYPYLFNRLARPLVTHISHHQAFPNPSYTFSKRLQGAQARFKNNFFEDPLSLRNQQSTLSLLTRVRSVAAQQLYKESLTPVSHRSASLLAYLRCVDHLRMVKSSVTPPFEVCVAGLRGCHLTLIWQKRWQLLSQIM